jgi:N-hydroxyarylamine O-acetyltransferase
MALDRLTVEEYLSRIGAEWPQRCDVDALRTLQEKHVRSVPFENIDCFRRRPLKLGEDAVEKIVRLHRGGGCYELNSAMGLLLEGLGYPVTVLGGRIYEGENLTFPLRHLVLRVETPEGTWLVDVGFGFGGNRNSWHPLRFDDRSAQSDPQGEYRLVDAPDGDVDVVRDGTPLYRVERHPRELHEFSATLWWFLTSPESDFLQNLWCILPNESGRVSIKDRTLTRVVAGEKSKTELKDQEELRQALAESFGIVVDEIPDLLDPTDRVAANLAAAAT